MQQPGDPVVSQEELWEVDEIQCNLAYQKGYHLYAYPHSVHFKHEFHADMKVLLYCWFHSEVCSTKPQELDAGPTPPATASEKVLDMPTFAVLYEYIQAENRALKLQLASLQCLVNNIQTEIKKLVPTTLQHEFQIPEAALAPPSQQPMEKWKRTISQRSITHTVTSNKSYPGGITKLTHCDPLCKSSQPYHTTTSCSRPQDAACISCRNRSHHNCFDLDSFSDVIGK
jgi:hypothetical protein